MVSDDERREIAASLRESREFISCLPYASVGENAFATLDRILACVGYERGNIFDYLADLIDRGTCRNVSKTDGGFECSECKLKAEIVGEDCNEYGEVFSTPLMPRFCLFCGRKVVRDGD